MTEGKVYTDSLEIVWYCIVLLHFLFVSETIVTFLTCDFKFEISLKGVICDNTNRHKTESEI